jgi:hypothetical protein
VIASGMNNPNGVALKNGNLFVAEISKVTKFADIEKNIASPERVKLFMTSSRRNGRMAGNILRLDLTVNSMSLLALLSTLVCLMTGTRLSSD